MDRDGTQDGYDLEMIAAVSRAVSIPVVASGGAGCPEHLAEAVQIGKASAVLAASIFHFGKYSIRQTKQFMRARGIPVRLEDEPHDSTQSRSCASSACAGDRTLA
jgi:cyclase